MWGFDYMKEDTVLTSVSIDDNNKVTIVNYTDDIVDRPFGVCTAPTIKDVENLFAERCFPETRFNAKQILKGKPYGYDRYSIIRDNHGILVEDYYWIRFDDEKNLCWDDVKAWRFPK